jgi:phage I-like protein
MDKHFGWWIDLSTISLSDGQNGSTSWVHALPFGKYTHPLHGELDFDSSKLSALATSVKNRTRGIDPDIDYDHKTDVAKGNQAAGWVKDAEVRADGLHLKVDWTPTAVQEIKDKRYRYFSAEFVDEWQDPQGVAHKDVLFGGGLTNRPWMKNLLPVNLSELMTDKPKDAPEADMDLKKLREILGLGETATEADVIAKLTELGTSITQLTEEKTKLTAEIVQLKEGDKPGNFDPALKQLIDASPAFAKMHSDLLAEQKKLAEAQTAIRLAEVTGQLNTLQQGKTFALAPSAREGLQTILLKSTSEAGKTLFTFLESVMDGSALVDLSERGYVGRELGRDGDATNRFNSMVKQLMEKESLDYGTAVERIARENAQLFAEYREATYTFKA